MDIKLIKQDRRKSIAVYVSFLLLAAVLGFFRPIGNVDELWNFTFGNNMAMGLVPYRDFNLLQTPLFAMIHGLFLAVFGRELLVTRMLGALLFSGICLLLYNFSRKMGANGLSALVLPIFFLVCFDYNVFYEYSCTILFVQLICMYTDCSVFWDDHKKTAWFRGRTQILCGVASGVGIMCKQTFGGFVALASWICVLIVCRYYRAGAKRTMKMLVFRLLGSSLPCFLVLFYLLETNSFDDLWDMCVRGISTFSSSLTMWEYMAEDREYLFTGLGFLLTVAVGIVYTVHYRRQKKGQTGVLVLIYSVFGCINLYPLCNTYHILTCLVPFLVLVAPLLGWFGRKKWLRLLCLLAVVAGAGYILIWTPGETLKSSELLTDIDHFHGIFMEKEEIADFSMVVEEILDRRENNFEVYILDNQAVQYLIPADIYHKYLDMFLVGNLGTKTPEECLEDSLLSEKQVMYLIPSDFKGQYQYPRTEVEEFIREKLNYAQTIGHFDCYLP